MTYFTALITAFICAQQVFGVLLQPRARGNDTACTKPRIRKEWYVPYSIMKSPVY
jgi:hypothetical protein